MNKAKLIHVESRASMVKEGGFEFLVQCDARGCSTRSLIASLKKSVDDVVLHRDDVPKRGEMFAWNSTVAANGSEGR